MTVEAAPSAPEPSDRRKAKVAGATRMSKSGERPILSITSPKILGLFGAFLAILASGFLFLVVHIWDDIDKHLENIDGQLAGLNVTQGKFEQFLISKLPGITKDLKRNTELMFKLESNVSALSQSVSQVQRQVSIATEEIEKLKEAPMKKGSLLPPDGLGPVNPTAAR